MQAHLQHVKDILTQIEFKYPNWNYVVDTKNDEVFLQGKWQAPDATTGTTEDMSSRKYFISKYALDAEIIQTALVCALGAVEHELREHFLVDGYRIFGPHIDPKARLNLKDEAQPRSEILHDITITYPGMEWEVNTLAAFYKGLWVNHDYQEHTFCIPGLSNRVTELFQVILSAMQREVREHFYYQGQAIFRDSIDISELQRICNNTVVRPTSNSEA